MEENQTQQEKVFYSDNVVTVSQSRYIAGNKTYAMRNISSVSVYKVSSGSTIEMIILVLGIILAALGKSTRIIGIIAAVAALILMMMKKDKYSVRISTNAGEDNSLISPDKAYIQKIVDALNEAIIQRG